MASSSASSLDDYADRLLPQALGALQDYGTTLARNSVDMRNTFDKSTAREQALNQSKQNVVTALEKVSSHIGTLSTTLNAFLDAQLRELDKSVAEVKVLSEMVAISYETIGRNAVNDIIAAPAQKPKAKVQRGEPTHPVVDKSMQRIEVNEYASLPVGHVIERSATLGQSRPSSTSTPTLTSASTPTSSAGPTSLAANPASSPQSASPAVRTASSPSGPSSGGARIAVGSVPARTTAAAAPASAGSFFSSSITNDAVPLSGGGGGLAVPSATAVRSSSSGGSASALAASLASVTSAEAGRPNRLSASPKPGSSSAFQSPASALGLSAVPSVPVPVTAKKSSIQLKPSVSVGAAPVSLGPSAAAAAAPVPRGRMVDVLYSYTATEAEELNINAGEKVEILKEDAGSGWSFGRSIRNETGLFPSGYVRL